MRLHSALAAALFALGTAAAQAATFNSLVVFGDSLSDPGNAAGLTRNPDATSFFPPSPPYNQRFSNGKTAAEYLAESLGATVVPSYTGAANANNFATGGALTGNGNFNFIINRPTGLQAYPAIGASGIAQQISAFSPGSINQANTLYMVWGGANDLFLGFALAQAGQPVNFNTVVGTALGNLNSDIQALAAKGAQHFFVPNLPDLGLTPFARAQGATFMGQATALSDAFNLGLSQIITGYRNAGFDMYTYDVAGFMRGVVAAPGPNFTNVTDTCLSAGIAALPSCQGYLFFDDVHPTTFAHNLLAQQFAAAVPEPETYVMLAAGLVLLGWATRRRATRTPH